MISYIKGRVIFNSGNYIVIENSGIGYKVFVNSEGFKLNSETEVFTYHHVKEDASDLYGFAKSEDLKIFEVLISVSGVGPKVGQLIVDNLGREKIIESVKSSDLTAFKSIPGVGTKVAAKIIVELKSKVTSDKLINIDFEENNEVVDALLALGMSKDECIPYLKDIPSELDLQEKVKFVLKQIAKK